jgi:hypothetical protein
MKQTKPFKNKLPTGIRHVNNRHREMKEAWVKSIQDINRETLTLQ